ncbi:PREDICTED: proteasome subunit beta type-1 [Eufriesea mexicana]|uniref:proteasome subunit beta type-1 n=1 Tax=Eufriesea mexicana TaxID=516756 RepID=UPI00083C4737|nr:PREDICTED: proteasome subunit beta type-1 [Eufriesea mexicana]
MAFITEYPSRSLPDYETQAAKMKSFNPYADNGGSVIALAGDDFCVIAADTRLSAGFSIYTREQQKLFPLSSKTILGCSGCWCDTLMLTKLLTARMQIYEYEHQKKMTTQAIAQTLSIMLYYKRFFPYYVSNILGGLDEDGKGCVFSYDPIGHCEVTKYRAGGSAGALLQPLLDNQIGYKNQEGVEPIPLTQERAIAIIKDVFVSAAERDIYTGDSICIKMITNDGIQDSSYELRKD